MSDSEDVGLLRSAVRRDLLDTLANLPADRRDRGLSATELGEAVGLHASTVRFHLDQLVAAGLATSHFERSAGVGRPSKHYVATSGSLDASQQAESFGVLASLLAEMFACTHDDGSPLTPEEAGFAWAQRHATEWGGDLVDAGTARSAGAWLSKVGVMVDLLRDWGYTPNLRTEDSGRTVEVDLVDCPFLALAKDNPQVVCGVHRGLIRGALSTLGEGETETSLTPFVEPNRCLAHITTRADFAPRGGTR
ncbi:helix-turn-helix domain-containing protein [Marihabitans asiaticum]|uniref:Putative ArsR family transcriptional regulator n=1 Tax=Marihabitans asiaticum TaxID=415218 RepID=A0A560W7Z2_9MICO|nr:helix-turn-helix domain-containing protein [Marihabitans asiaticum]TWD13752.1 putative ArsR family transcriptional regulator [Marihabitans asiaticum]